MIGMAAGAAIIERSAEESAALVATNWSQPDTGECGGLGRGYIRGSHAVLAS